MKRRKPWHYASLLTVPSLVVILFQLYLYIVEYEILAKEERWGLLLVWVILFWSTIVFIAGLLIRHLVTTPRTRNIIEVIIFVLLVLYVSTLN